MTTRRAGRSVEDEVEERRERDEEPTPAPHNVALRMQQTHGNQAVARMLARGSRTLARFDPGYTFAGGSVVKDKVDSQASCNEAVETVIEEDLSGFEALFLQNEIATSPAEWAAMALSFMEDRYELEGIGQAEALKGVQWVKDKYRERELLRLSRMWAYDAPEGNPYSAENLVTRLIDAGAFLEVAVSGGGRLTGRDAEVLEAIHETEAAFARTQVRFDASKNIQLLDEDNIVVLIDSHQQKHQTTQIPQFPAYTGKPGSKFADGKDLAWHETTTAPVVKQTVKKAVEDGLMTPETESLSPSKDAINGIIYDLTITYDDATGKYVGGYHCNPVVNEGS